MLEVGCLIWGVGRWVKRDGGPETDDRSWESCGLWTIWYFVFGIKKRPEVSTKLGEEGQRIKNQA